MTSKYDYEVTIKKVNGPILPEDLFQLFDTILEHMKNDYRDIQKQLAQGEFSEITITFNYPHYTEEQNII